jgi:hypothetical protein
MGIGMISKDSVIVKQYKNLKKINAIKLLHKSIDNNKKAIADGQREQLKFGLDSEGKKIKPDYHDDVYADKKSNMNSLPGFGTPDLNLTGEMYKNIDVLAGVPNDKEYTIFSDVEYFPFLNERYDTAFGLSKKNIKNNIPQVNNDFLKMFHQALNK